MDKENYLTVKELRKCIARLPENTPVFYHRIEDVYFKKHGWKPDLLVTDEWEEGDEYIRAFAVFKHSDGVCITAHY